MIKGRKSLAETHPEIAKEWHPTLNESLTASEVTPGSHTKVWWKCDQGDDHEWTSTVNGRSSGQNCPVCSGKKVVLSNCLATVNPMLAKEWHPSLNGDLTALEVTSGSGKKAWWKCDKGDDHEWESTISNRSNGNKCPVCTNNKTVLSNCLDTVNPRLAKEWHSTKNGNLTPFHITEGSKTKVWWKCDQGDDHEWKTAVSDRLNGGNCPVCSGRKTVLSNCLATVNPKLAKEWHPIKNTDFTPFDITENSSKKAWWKCDQGEDHEWKTAISDRSRGDSCPVCSGRKTVLSNCLATVNPVLSQQWHPTKNGKLTAFDFTPGSDKKVWWKCDQGDDHEWKSVIKSRSSGQNCPVCSGAKTVLSNCLFTVNPKLAKEWHPTKNGELTAFDFTPGSGKKVWWKCDQGDDHEWKAAIKSRSSGISCPVCSGKKVVVSTCLATVNPKLAKEWHPTKNGNITPFDLAEYSNKKVWWKCEKGNDHEWKSTINARSNGANCSICSGNKVVLSNCLATVYPDLAKQWHPTKNGEFTPFDITVKSGKIAWWKCDKDDDHEWKTAIHSRSNGRNCPYCTLTPQSKQELTITFELKKLFKNIDPKGLKTKLERRLRAIDIYVPKLNLCIEFDGAYWHKNKLDVDKIKSEMLLQEGFKLIRVREEPLKKIYDTDVISKQPYNGKQVTNDVLSTIMDLYTLDEKLVSKIKDYQAKEELQNERGLDRYIDKILTEKAEKNADEVLGKQ